MDPGRTLYLWSSESHSGKREGYDSFDKRHDVRGRSRGRDGCTEENGKRNLVRERRKETPLYTLDTRDTSSEVRMTKIIRLHMRSNPPTEELRHDSRLG